MEKNIPHGMTLALCLTVGLVYFLSKRLPAGRRTNRMPSDPKKLFFDSSDQRIRAHCCTVQSLWSLANFIRAARFFFEIHGFFAGTRPLNPARIRMFRAVLSVMVSPRLSWAYWRTSTAVINGSFSACRTMSRVCPGVVFLGRPEIFRFFTEWVSFQRFHAFWLT